MMIVVNELFEPCTTLDVLNTKLTNRRAQAITLSRLRK
jgi:hypothetical protein